MAAKKKPVARKQARVRATAKGKPVARNASAKRAPTEFEVIAFESASDWQAWLRGNHAAVPGVWIKLAKKGSGLRSVTYLEAVDGALRWGWIDGQGRSLDAAFWLQKFTPRRSRSVWSKINRERALALIDRNEMQPAGLAEVERAQRDGRWDAAYDSSRSSVVPDDLRDALAQRPKAAEFFAKLNAANRYAILWRLQTAKRADTRARRIVEFVQMLARGEKLHP